MDQAVQPKLHLGTKNNAVGQGISEQAAEPVFVLHGPVQKVVAAGVKQTLSASPLKEVGGQVGAILKNIVQAEPGADLLPSMVVGGLPFAQEQACLLYQPQKLWSWNAYFDHAQQAAQQAIRLQKSDLTDWRIQAVPSRHDYAQMVERARALLTDQEGRFARLQKVVLARTLVAEHSAASMGVHELLSLLKADPSVTAYSLPLGVHGQAWHGHLVGASPELLLSRKGAQIFSHPLAGSARRTHDSRDAQAQHQLLRSTKDLHEHRLVVEFIADALAPYCAQLTVPASPAICATASMWHLGTGIEGTLKHPDDLQTSSSLALAALLQPTPALGGSPRDLACELIASLEPFERGFFGGAVGWCDAQGQGSWHVAIRCAEMTPSQTRLFAGAGIVDASDPNEEAAETRAKFQAMIDALGWSDAVEAQDKIAAL